MREIKYRLWNPCRNGYHYDVDTVMDCLKQQISGLYDHEKEYGGVFEQYTGISQYGVEFYEGDVITFTVFDCFGNDKPRQTGVIEWEEDGWAVNLAGSEGNYYQLGFITSNDDTIEVIGNIHQNPELLEELE